MKKIIFTSVLFFGIYSLHAQQWTIPDAAGNINNTNTGNVGIGTATPTEKLSVAGNIQLSGKTYWSWPQRCIEEYLDADGVSKVMRFRNSLNVGAGNPRGGFDFTDENGFSVMRLMGNNLGIGTTNPTTRLHVEGGGLINGDLLVGAQMDNVGYGHRVNWDNSGNTDPLWMARYNTALDATEFRMNIGDDGGNDKFVIGYHFYGDNLWKPQATFRADGQVGIGTTNISDWNYKLFVETGIRTRKVKVDMDTWSDYVFYQDYRLRPLAQVEKFIRENRHLPDIPSADSVQRNGLDLGTNQAALLKKIEELTLYLIQQDKKIEVMSKELKALTAHRRQPKKHTK